MLRATTACNFSFLLWPAGSAPAALARLLFDPPEPQIIGKHRVSRLSYLFAHLHLLSSLSFSSLIFSLLFLRLLDSSHLCFSICFILSEVWLLNFHRNTLFYFVYIYIFIYLYIHLILCNHNCNRSFFQYHYCTHVFAEERI